MSPKSTRAELGELRDQAFARDGGCRWPGCVLEVSGVNPLQMAHLNHRGMGGRTSVNTLDQVVVLCRTHHDCLDGRTSAGTLGYELKTMLRAVIRDRG